MAEKEKLEGLIKDKPDWHKSLWFWVIDKAIIAIVVLVVTAAVNYHFEQKKSLLKAKSVDAQIAVEKAGQLWSVAGQLRASLERINRLKMKKDWNEMFKDSRAQKSVAEIEKMIKKEVIKSQQLDDELETLIRANQYYVGKGISEHLSRYSQTLKAYYFQKNSLMFDKWPRHIDQSQRFKDLDEFGDMLDRMEVDAEATRDYAVRKFVR